MSIVDDRLYALETKAQLRDAINLRGGTIGGADTFRSYVNQLQQLIWLPDALFAGGEQGAWYDPSDLSTLFQDAAGTIPVTTAGDPVGMMQDKSGNGNHARQATAAARPTYQTDGALHWLATDGVDDFMTIVSASIPSVGPFYAQFGILFNTLSSGFHALMAKGQTSNGEFLWYAASLRHRLYVDSGQIDTGSSSGNQLIAGVVYLLDMFLADETAKLYRNGGVDPSDGGSFNISSPKNLTLFASNDGSERHTNLRFYGGLWLEKNNLPSSVAVTSMRAFLALRSGVAL